MKGIDWWGTLGAVVGILVALLIAGILYLLITSLPARAAEPTRAQVAAAVDPAFRKPPTPWIVLAIAAVADVATTEAALHRGCHEANPIYGRHPSLPLLIGAHAIPLALAWPVRRSPWLYLPAALFAGAALHNAGVRCHG